MRKKPEFDILSSASITETKDLVISKSSIGGYVLAQRINSVDSDTNEKHTMYSKGIIILKDKESLLLLRDALTVAIEKIKTAERNEDWDE